MKKRLLSMLCALTPDPSPVPSHRGAFDMGKVGQTSTVSAGDCHSMAIKKDGTLWTWGSNERSQIGIGGVGNETVVMDDMFQGRDEYPFQTIPVQVLTGVALPRGTAPAPAAPQYIYDTTDPGKAVVLPTENLDTATSTDTAVSAVSAAVSAAVSGMTAERKSSATGADWATARPPR